LIAEEVDPEVPPLRAGTDFEKEEVGLIFAGTLTTVDAYGEEDRAVVETLAGTTRGCDFVNCDLAEIDVAEEAVTTEPLREPEEVDF